MLRLCLPSFFIDLFVRDKTSIEFLSENLDQVLKKTESVAPYKAGRLCTMPPSNLLFVDESKSPREIRWMDCTKEPKVLERVISTNHKDIWEIQFSREGGLVLVIAAPGSEGFHAYQQFSGRLKWSVVDKLPTLEKKIWPCGMAKDEKGRLFVCDSSDGNNCIQMFRVVDGNYLGCLIKKGDKGLQNIAEVLLCEEIKSLAVGHGKDRSRSNISTVKLH